MLTYRVSQSSSERQSIEWCEKSREISPGDEEIKLSFDMCRGSESAVLRETTETENCSNVEARGDWVMSGGQAAKFWKQRLEKPECLNNKTGFCAGLVGGGLWVRGGLITVAVSTGSAWWCARRRRQWRRTEVGGLAEVSLTEHRWALRGVGIKRSLWLHSWLFEVTSNF